MKAKQLFTAFLVVALTVVCCPQAMAQGNGKGKGGGGNDPPPFTVVDLLGLPGGNHGGSLQSEAVAVNEPDGSGHVQLVGNSHELGNRHPAKWSVSADGSQVTITDLGLAAGELAASGEDINDLGELVFHTIIENDPDVPDDEEGAAWVVVPGQAAQELPKSGGVTAHVTAINNSGVIVGNIVFVNGTTRTACGALWRLDANGIPSSPIDLGSFLPRDISETGVMAGLDDDARLAAIATLDGDDNPVIESLGALPGNSYSAADGISPDGNWVVGYSHIPDGDWEGFRWSKLTGIMVGLGRLGGNWARAYDVNDAGHVVGTSDTDEGRYGQAAFLWQDGQISDLNSMVDGKKKHLYIGYSITNAGHIAGLMSVYTRNDSNSHGFLLIPREQ